LINNAKAGEFYNKAAEMYGINGDLDKSAQMLCKAGKNVILIVKKIILFSYKFSCFS
jgi:hypothetical protein